MIVNRRKPLSKIIEMTLPHKRVLVLGCGECATVCLAGGEEQVAELVALLRIAAKDSGREVEFRGATCERVCDWDYVEPVLAENGDVDAIVSLSCGTGVNLLADRLEKTDLLPGTDTVFMGANVAPGVWSEYCAGCGECILDKTFGICPIARCAKTLFNGPCGGSSEGKCEISPDVDCAWAKIVERARAMGRLEELAVLSAPKDWSTSSHGGPGKVERPDVMPLIEDKNNESGK